MAAGLRAASITVSLRGPDGSQVENREWSTSSIDLLAVASPWRTFRWYKGQRHYSGTYWSATMHDHVIYESRLELARLLFADFDLSVRRVVAQPFLLKAEVDGAVRKHIPDYLLVTDEGPVVVDVKPLHRLSKPEVAFTFGWTREAVEARGWKYEVWSEPPTAELENVRFLSGYRRDWLFDRGLVDELRVADLNGVSLRRAACGGQLARSPGGASSISGLSLAVDARVHGGPRPAVQPGALAQENGVTRAGARVGVGTHFRYDGETVEVVEMAATTAGNEVVLKDRHGRLLRLSLRELLFADRAALIPEGPGPSSDDAEEIASVVLGQLDEKDRQQILERAEHIRELLTGYRSGSTELACEGEPRAPYAPTLSLTPAMRRKLRNSESLIALFDAGSPTTADTVRPAWYSGQVPRHGPSAGPMTDGWRPRWKSWSSTSESRSHHARWS